MRRDASLRESVGAGRVSGAAAELSHVTFAYGARRGRGGEARPVLNDVCVTFPRGMVSVLVGPNGCGKSTLVRCVARGLSLAGGEIRVEGRPVRALSPRERARFVAVMPQGAAPPDMEVERLVLSGRYPHRGLLGGVTADDIRIAREAMERAGCLRLAERNVRELSGGERQRAFFAMVLAQRARVVILDEPTAYLDPGAAFDLARMVGDLRAAGTSVIMVLHDIPLAMACADRIAVLRAGCLAAFGTPEDVAASGAIDETFGVRLCRASLGGAGQGGVPGVGWCLLPGPAV